MHMHENGVDLVIFKDPIEDASDSIQHVMASIHKINERLSVIRSQVPGTFVDDVIKSLRHETNLLLLAVDKLNEISDKRKKKRK